MLSKGGNNEILAAWGEGNDPNASVFGALDPADQALRYEAIDSDTDRAWGQIYHWAYRIDGQRPFCAAGVPARRNPRGRVRSRQYRRLRTLSGRASPSSLLSRRGPSCLGS